MKCKKIISILFCTLCVMSGGVLADSTYDTTISIDPNIQHGSIIVSASQGNIGDEISLTAIPDEGYKLKENSIKVKSGNTIVAIGNTFVIPSDTQIIKTDVDLTNWTQSGTCNSSYSTYNSTGMQVRTKKASGNYFTYLTSPTFDSTAYTTFYATIAYKTGWDVAESGDTTKSGYAYINAIDALGTTKSSNWVYQFTIDYEDNVPYYVTRTISLSVDGYSKVQLVTRTSSSAQSYSYTRYTDAYFITQKNIPYPSLTVTAEFEPIDVNYTVNYYVEQLDGSYTLQSSEIKTALADSEISKMELQKEIIGFTENKLTEY